MIRRTCVAFLMAAVWLAAPALFAQEVHSDPKIGFKVRLPRDFSRVPLKPDEEWIVARWICDRAFYQVDPSNGRSLEHRPEINVIAFLDAATKVVSKNPYKDYRDYLKRTYTGGGFHISADEKTQVEGIAAECLEVKVERGAAGGPRRIVTWVFEIDNADVAVQFEMVEVAWPKLKSEILSSLRSFRVIPREGVAPNAPRSGAPVVATETAAEMSKLPPVVRMRNKIRMANEEEAKLAADLLDGWSAKKLGRIFVLSHIDEKTAQGYAADATAVLDWLDENLGWIGPGEYVRDPIVRICKDRDEERVYTKGSEGSSYSGEIVTHKNLGSRTSGVGPEKINRACLEHWFRERDDELWRSLPGSLRNGVLQAFGDTRAKGRELEFFSDSGERVAVAEQIRAGKFLSLRDLMRIEPKKLECDGHKVDECAAAARFLLTGPKKAREALRAYLTALGSIVKKEAEEHENAAASNDDRPKTVDDEDAAFKAQHTAQREAGKTRLEAVFAAAFGSWTDADWRALDGAYQRSLD